MSRPNILIVNDDGIESPGLRVLAEAAAQIGEVWVVAPEQQCSGMSQKISIFEETPIRRRELPIPVRAAWSLGGTPADCVKAAVNHLLPVKADYLFSGINLGYNAGYDVAYSGTIGAAMEGLKGILWDRRLAPMQLYLDDYHFLEQPDGTLRMKNRSSPAPAELAEEGTDIHAVLNGYISIGLVRSMVL